MDINPITPSAQTVSTAASSGASSLLTSDFEVFLQMLTTQARYQDPLEPIDSSEYAAQLAQFSMVEQQVQTNTLMEQLVSALNISESSNLASWIGLEALTSGPADFSGAPLTVYPNANSAADELYLIAKDSAGNTVDRRQISNSSDPVIWDGETSSGTAASAGAYSFEVEALAQGEVISTEAARVYGRVTEARMDAGTTYVVLASGYLVPATDVQGLRQPQ